MNTLSSWDGEMCQHSSYGDARRIAELVLDYEHQKNEYLRRSYAEHWDVDRVRREAQRISKLYDSLVGAARSVVRSDAEHESAPESA